MEVTETVYYRYKSERETADRNYALAYYMRENKVQHISVQWFSVNRVHKNIIARI